LKHFNFFQVKNTLEELILDFDTVTPFASLLPTNFRLPSSLPNLKILKIFALDLFNICKQAIGPEHYPRLEVLSLGCHGFKDPLKMNSCLYSTQTPSPTVKELRLIGSRSVDLVLKAQALFPSVTSLTVNPESDVTNQNDDISSYFNTIAIQRRYFAGGWMLEKLRVVQDCKFETLFQWLEYISVKGMYIFLDFKWSKKLEVC
jgi:hypothetical protein